MKRYLALCLLLVNIWAVSSSCPEINNFDGSMIKYSGESGIEEIIFACAPKKYLSGPRVIRCVNGTWSDNVPFCQNTSRCSNILPPEHGAIKKMRIAPDGTIEVEFECDEGYILDDRYDAAIRCDGATGFWSNTAPTCKNITACEPLSEPMNGQVNLLEGTWQDPHAVIGFTCNDGYYLVGPEKLKCNGTGFWNQMPPMCQEIVPCGPVSAPINGKVVQLPSRDVGSQRVMFYCNEGYMVQGSEYNRCEKGVWLNQMPTCVVRANCPVPQPHSSVRMLPISKTYEDRSIISFTCIKYQQRMIGSKRMFCKEGKWQGKMPICEDRLCKNLFPPNLGSMTTSDRGGLVRPGTLATFACNEGLTYYGTKKRICSDWGSWSYSRWSVCDLNTTTCPNLTDPNASVKTTSWSKQPYPNILSSVQIRCNTGFTPTYNTYVNCQPGGRWSRIPRECIALAKCLMHPTPMHSTLSSHQAYVGQNINVTCDKGYEMVGSSYIYCNMRWSKGVKRPLWSKTPTCQKIPEPSVTTEVVSSTDAPLITFPGFPPIGSFELPPSDGFELPPPSL